MIVSANTYRRAAGRLETLQLSGFPLEYRALDWAIELRGAAEALDHHTQTVIQPQDSHQTCEEVAENYRQLSESVWEFFQFKDSPSPAWREKALEILEACARDLNIGI